MVFLIGRDPLRRTLKYLNKCKIVFRDNVRIFFISYSPKLEHHAGARDFVYWHLSQIQYKNPTVQCIEFKDFTPTPFFKVYYEDQEPLLVDLDCRKRQEIYDYLEQCHLISKTREEQKAQDDKKTEGQKTIYFGSGCQRHCLCEIRGQIPCTALVPVPKHWRGVPPKEKKLLIPPCFGKWYLDKENRDKTD